MKLIPLLTNLLDQLAKPTFRSRCAHTYFPEHGEGPMDTVLSTNFRVTNKWTASKFVFHPTETSKSQIR